MRSLVISLLLLCSNAYSQVEIIHINIGQGDATLILGPKENGRKIAVLIDAGNVKNPDAGKVIAGLLKSKGVSVLDSVIVTHYDADHIGGLITKPEEALRNYWGSRVQDGVDGIAGNEDDIEFKQLVDRGFVGSNSISSTTFKQYKKYANAHNNHIKIKTKHDINNFRLSLGDGATLITLSANGFVKGLDGKVPDITTENEASLSFLLNYKDFHYYVGGDVTGRPSGGEDAKIETAIADYLVSENIELDAFQVNHHGANNGSSLDFLSKTKPKLAIISAGNGNSHKHPTYAALKRLTYSSVQSIYTTEFGMTVWNDAVLGKKSGDRSVAEKEQVEEIQAIRDKMVIAQSNIVLKSNGSTFTVSIMPTYMSAKL